MRRSLSFLSTVLFALTVMPPASATAPVREISPGQDDVVISGQCAFPVLGHVEGIEIITTFTDATGAPVKQITTFPGNMLSLTNLVSSTSVTVAATGTSQLRVGSDGSLSALVTGHGPFFPHPLTGEPGIWYLSGRARATFDAQGNQLSGRVTGTLVDLCVRLAP